MMILVVLSKVLLVWRVLKVSSPGPGLTDVALTDETRIEGIHMSTAGPFRKAVLLFAATSNFMSPGAIWPGTSDRIEAPTRL